LELLIRHAAAYYEKPAYLRRKLASPYKRRRELIAFRCYVR
jgi:hypothetical protein